MTRHQSGFAGLLPGLLAILLAALLAGCTSAAMVDTRPALLKEADTQISKGVNHYNMADYPRALTQFERALHGYRSIDDPEGIAASCINLAKTKLAQGDADTAAQWLDAAQRFVDVDMPARLESRILIIRSSIAIENGMYEEARMLLQPVIDAAPEATDAETRQAALQNRARIAIAENDDAATWIDRYAEAVKDGHPSQQARLERFRAATEADGTIMDSHYRTALKEYRQLASRPGIAATLSEWGSALLQRGDVKSAGDKLSRALYVRAAMTDTAGTIAILEQFNNLYHKTANSAGAEETRAWIERLNSPGFDEWEALTQSYSAFPD